MLAEQGIELLTAGQLLIRLVERFPDKMRAAHEKTVRYSLPTSKTVTPRLTWTPREHALTSDEPR